MGQFVAVLAPDSRVAEFGFSRLLLAATELFGQPAWRIHKTDHCLIASFPRAAVNDESGEIVPDSTGGWCLGVGTWICLDGGLRAWATNGHARDLSTGLSRIDGSFFLMLSDAKGRRIRIATDPIGQLHVYQRSLGEATLISTSSLALSLVADAEWNMDAIREFMAKGTVFGKRSLFTGIEKLEPATIFEFRGGKERRSRRHWSPGDHIDSVPGPHVTIDAFGATVTQSMAALFNRYPDPVLDLTGGFDSRILLTCARRAAPTRHASTVVVGPQDDPDVAAANGIARKLGLDHRRVDNSTTSATRWWQLAETAVPLVDGEYDSLEYADILHVHNQLAERFDVSINGSGGELIRGYWWELLWPRIGARGRFDNLRVARARFANDRWAEALFATQFSNALDEHFAAVIEEATRPLAYGRNTACMDNVYLTLRMQRWQGRIASATNRIWPCTSPLLFRRSMEIALATPLARRRNGRMARHLLTHLDQDLARLPMAGGYPAVPLSASTLPDFMPLGKEYTLRALRRVRRAPPQPSAANIRRQRRLRTLMKLDHLRDDLLKTSRMLTRELYDQHALEAFLGNARIGNPGALSRLGRLLTLEQVARLNSRLRPQLDRSLAANGAANSILSVMDAAVRKDNFSVQPASPLPRKAM